jgi:hypothetical protein
MRLPFGQPWTNVGPWVLASLPFVFLVAWFWNRGPGIDADDWAQTLMHAEALVEGRPYGDVGYIATNLDLAPPRQPPGLPVLVATVTTLTGGFAWATVKPAMALAAFPFLLLAGLAFARTHGQPIGLAVTVMLTVAVAASPPSGATHVQSDLGFASLVWGSLYLLDGPAKLTWPRVLAVFALASFAMSYRYLGAALVPTIGLYALLNRDKGGRKLAVPIAAWAVGALAVVALVGPSIITSQISLRPSRLWRGLLPMVEAYTGSAVGSHLYPLPWDVGNDIFHAASLSLAVLGIVTWTRTSWRTAAWLFTAAYLLTLLMAFNRAGRYLIPLFPVLIFGFLHGIRVVVGAIRREWADVRTSAYAAACGGLVAFPALLVLTVQEPRRGGYLHETDDARALFAYLTTAPDAAMSRVVFVQPRVLAWATGIPAMVTPGVAPRLVLPEMERQGITHVVLDRLDLQADRTRRMREAFAMQPCRFELGWQNASFEVYRFLPECRGS